MHQPAPVTEVKAIPDEISDPLRGEVLVEMADRERGELVAAQCDERR